MLSDSRLDSISTDKNICVDPFASVQQYATGEIGIGTLGFDIVLDTNTNFDCMVPENGEEIATVDYKERGMVFFPDLSQLLALTSEEGKGV